MADGVNISSLQFCSYICVQPPTVNKTWAITYDECEVYTIYGKTGSKLNFYRKLFNSRHEAENYITKKIAEKERKGYSSNGFMSVDDSELNFATS
ncbi:WGR domain-containing protein (plasmid) [Vibrio scophthalmi]|uniref:WGR domain-containing protein n=1 Tax=Vibrio scophthalmi TaxID=45658 RepID=UPI003EBBA832